MLLCFPLFELLLTFDIWYLTFDIWHTVRQYWQHTSYDHGTGFDTIASLRATTFYYTRSTNFQPYSAQSRIVESLVVLGRIFYKLLSNIIQFSRLILKHTRLKFLLLYVNCLRAGRNERMNGQTSMNKHLSFKKEWAFRKDTTKSVKRKETVEKYRML